MSLEPKIALLVARGAIDAERGRITGLDPDPAERSEYNHGRLAALQHASAIITAAIGRADGAHCCVWQGCWWPAIEGTLTCSDHNERQ